MRIGIAIAVGLLSGTFADAKPDPAAAKAANTKGVTLAKAKKYKEAEVEYQKAIAADPTFVLAHYNLACAAALAGDHDVAIAELAWVANAASYDAGAKAALAKAPKDKDLAGLLEQDIEATRWTQPQELVDVTKGRQPAFAGKLATDADKAKLGAPLAAAAGAHDNNCDPKDAKQGRLYALPLIDGPTAKDTLVGTLRDGVGLLDAKGALVARSEPLGCTAPGASQDMLQGLVYVDGAQEGVPGVKTLYGTPMYVAVYTNGGKTEWTTSAAIFMQKGAQLVKVLDVPIGTLQQTVLGDLLYAPPDVKKSVVARWNAASFKFE